MGAHSQREVTCLLKRVGYCRRSCTLNCAQILPALTRIHKLFKEGLFLILIQIFICVSIVTGKIQKSPPTLQETRTAHFEILGNRRSDWGSDDIRC